MSPTITGPSALDEHVVERDEIAHDRRARRVESDRREGQRRRHVRPVFARPRRRGKNSGSGNTPRLPPAFFTACVRLGVCARTKLLPAVRIGSSCSSRWSAQQERSARSSKAGASEASLPENTTTGWSASMSELREVGVEAAGLQVERRRRAASVASMIAARRRSRRPDRRR